MERLYGVKVDENRWKVYVKDTEYFDSYKLVDTENLEVYYFDNTIGLRQISENEFLLYKRKNYDYFEISRLILDNGKITKIYSKEFSEYHFLDDDKILFTIISNDAQERIRDIYSIKENKNIEEAKWLNHKKIQFDGKDFLIIDNICDDKIIFKVNIDTFDPCGYCFSTLRNGYIRIKAKEDYEKLLKEERKYINIIHDYYFNLEQENMKKASKKLLNIK